MIVIASDAGSLRRVLEGKHIVAYDATEMALWEQGADGVPVFGHPEVPCIQGGGITLRFDDGTHLRVQTDQTPDGWGLLLEDDPPSIARLELMRLAAC